MSTKKRKVADENRRFNKLRTEEYAVIESDDGEFLKDCMCTVSGILYNDFKNKDLILSKIKDIPLSARTVKERILNNAEEVSNMKIEDVKTAEFLSLAIDKSVDVTDISQCCVMVKYLTAIGVQEEALVAKSLGAIPQLKNVMEVIVPIVNFIRAKSLNHRIFTALLEEMDFIRKELVTFTAVRWLSRGKTLK
ncbi:zinc finger BED domain-containing protein 5-like [Hydra vulgaris]|uniref:Zinc finger BED domain-containing protein 5-like n=1 Tax=Hydra vulgaris TaxID=6087 RepID=A0ABM4CMC7_HYDVU